MHNPIPEHKYLFVIGMLCTLASVIFGGFCLYIFPYLFLDIQYKIPNLVHRIIQWYELQYGLQGIALSFWVFLSFFIIAVFFMLAARIISRILDKAAIQPEETESKKVYYAPRHPAENPETIIRIIKIFLVVVCILFALFVLHELIYSDNIPS